MSLKCMNRYCNFLVCVLKKYREYSYEPVKPTVPAARLTDKPAVTYFRVCELNSFHRGKKSFFLVCNYQVFWDITLWRLVNS